MFVVVLEKLGTRAEVIGTFPHEEDARVWAEKNTKTFQIWRVAKVTPPTEHK